MKKVIWGILSTAKIGLKPALPGMLKSERLEVRAIASRASAAARAAAAALGIPRAYGS
jgi:predicted dehydrogenase